MSIKYPCKVISSDYTNICMIVDADNISIYAKDKRGDQWTNGRIIAHVTDKSYESEFWKTEKVLETEEELMLELL